MKNNAPNPNREKFLKVIEFLVVGFVTWLDPTATGLLYLLRFCFLILSLLPKKSDKSGKNNEKQDK